MSTNTRNLRKSVLCMAMGVCLSSLAAAPVLAQSVTGAVAGEAQAGTQVTITNPATGLTRSATVDADGSYRIGQLPPGQYVLTAGGGQPIAVTVSLGGTTTVNLTNEGAVNLSAVQVVGSRVVNRVDLEAGLQVPLEAPTDDPATYFEYRALPTGAAVLGNDGAVRLSATMLGWWALSFFEESWWVPLIGVAVIA